MALGLFGSKGDAPRNSNSSDDKSSSHEKGSDPELGRIEKPSRRDMDDDSDGSITVGKQMAMEAENAIKYRTCSWQKTAALLFSEYICLAIMSFPWSYSILGLVPGLILTVVIAGLVLYTSLITWEFCLRHPEVRDVCDLGQMIFWNKKWAFYFTAVMFLLNNTFIMGLHCLVGAKWWNTITGHGICTIGFSAITAVISFAGSIPRTFNGLAKIATFSALFTFISVILAAAFSGAEGKPAGYPSKGEPTVLAVPAAGTSFVLGMSAFMNISYTFIGQITLPSFIAEMKEPKDFPKALWVVTICEVIVFSLVGGIVYGYTGTQYMTSPAFGSLENEVYKKVAFTFMVPTIIFLGVLYASVSARFVFFRVFAGTKHLGNHTFVGWATWIGILALLWVFAFIIAEVIPFFSDLLSLMSSLFDSFFGFIFWGVAYMRLRRAKYGEGFWKTRGFRGYFGFFFNILLCLIGLLFLTAGTYATVQSIIDGYKLSSFGGPFTCQDNGL
ncbi:transmembrane amino acid transporter protein-domain-containing protein [Paraphoma chrysanthemicola]|uniref:Transmembrane amino acid transporter protein-domain-containing protein n=1 Tax=Paraphoma chrysanthemicola TaxID=798071 RepID=A0A8K0RMQ8_9PLEO|nr:transmembrane amino acid transporter protein-domain-containing protein [Paraphoma chrysanthemicola]